MLPSGEANIQDTPDFTALGHQRSQNHFLENYSSPTIMRCFELLSPLDWAHFPERNLQRNWGQVTIPYAALAAAEVIRLNEGLPSMGHLWRFLIEHPGFIWLLGFPLRPAPETLLGFNPMASLPSERHLAHP
jgi:hypothetical protein